MKKILFLPLLLMSILFCGCSMNDLDEVMPQHASTTIMFNVVNSPMTRAASVGDNWPTTATHENALQVVEDVYSTPKDAGISFFTSNYSVNLTNDKGGSITAWDGSTSISLTEKNTFTVTLTEKNEGAFPKFKTATGWIDLSTIDLDTATPTFTSANYGGDIVITGISVADGKVNVTIQVNLTYDSYLLVAPSADWTILTNVKGFKSLCWGGSSGTVFNAYTLNNKKWWYYWGHGNEYVWGSGTILSYGFNFYSDGSDDIKVENGKWYGVFASLSSAGEGDDNTGGDTSKTHTVGGDNGVVPTANDVVGGGAIR